MRAVFADTLYWVAMLDVRDPWHSAVVQAARRLGKARFVTTDAVLLETVNALSAAGVTMRRGVVRYVRHLFASEGVEVVPQDRALLLAGMDLHDKRPDKEYSLTDCISMVVMRERSLREVLTNDHHFGQEGFTVLIGEDPRR